MRYAGPTADVSFEVEDTGGYSIGDLPRRVRRFIRVDKARSRSVGARAGLAIVKHLVQADEGHVRVARRPEGTTFRVTLPRLERLETGIRRDY